MPTFFSNVGIDSSKAFFISLISRTPKHKNAEAKSKFARRTYLAAATFHTEIAKIAKSDLEFTQRSLNRKSDRNWVAL